MTFCSSRMLPGQSYTWNSLRVFLPIFRIRLPDFVAYRSIRYSTSNGISRFVFQLVDRRFHPGRSSAAVCGFEPAEAPLQRTRE